MTTTIFVRIPILDYRAELEEAESHMREWVELFLIEIEKIETFYCSKF